MVSADDFFVDPSGNYVYLPHLISKAHEWARAKVGKFKLCHMPWNIFMVIFDFSQKRP